MKRRNKERFVTTEKLTTTTHITQESIEADEAQRMAIKAAREQVDEAASEIEADLPSNDNALGQIDVSYIETGVENPAAHPHSPENLDDTEPNTREKQAK